MGTMGRMVFRRFLIGIATLFVVSVLVFAGTEILPGDVAQIILGQSATTRSRGFFQHFQWGSISCHSP